MKSLIVDKFYEHLTGFQKEVSEILRELVLSANPTIEESIKWRYPCYTYKGLLCGIFPAKRHVTIVFHKGTKFSDESLLHLYGEGKMFRYIRYESKAQINTQLVNNLIAEAIKINEKK